MVTVALITHCGLVVDTQQYRMDYVNGYCCGYGSYPIKVKACPDNYYVYEL
ncbi:hypothetical protein M9458_043155, partial [Cirrhinus mrigala]